MSSTSLLQVTTAAAISAFRLYFQPFRWLTLSPNTVPDDELRRRKDLKDRGESETEQVRLFGFPPDVSVWDARRAQAELRAEREVELENARHRGVLKVLAGSKSRDRTVYRRDDGTWVNKRNDAGRASSVHNTRKKALDTARRMLRDEGGGELVVKGRDGKIQSRDTIPPRRDSKDLSKTKR